MRSHEEMWGEAFRAQSAVGLPSNLQHDTSRVFGWSNILGQYIDGEMVRTLGYIEVPENDSERIEINTRCQNYWKQYHNRETEQYVGDLLKRFNQVSTEGFHFFRGEAVFAKKRNLAAQVYPNFFGDDSEIVDKDGLVFYKDLISQAVELMPGVYHEKKNDLILVAHRFFRRSRFSQELSKLRFHRRILQNSQPAPGT